MPEDLSRSQVAVYAGLGVVLLLLGVKALRGVEAPSSDPGGATLATEPTGSGAGGVAGNGGGAPDLVVHVAGEVAEPGVFRLPVGSRVADALERAGGPTRKGLPGGVNLAARLVDGQQVVVPSRAPAGGGGATVAGEEGPISLGSADAGDLEEIEGIGPVTAEKIIEFRDQRGGIGSIEELDEISGIGPATIESLSGSLQP